MSIGRLRRFLSLFFGLIGKGNGQVFQCDTPPSDADALATAMSEAMGLPPATLDAMGRKGRTRVIARHDSDAAAAALDEAFRLFSPGMRE